MDFVLTLKIMFCGVFDFNFEFKNFFPEAEVWDFHATWISYQSEFLTFLNFQIEFSDYQKYGISDIRIKILNLLKKLLPIFDFSWVYDPF